MVFISEKAFSHAFEEKYDLPLPINYFLWGAALTVAFTYVIALVFLKISPHRISLNGAPTKIIIHENKGLEIVFQLLKIFIGVMVWVIATIAFTGPKNPLMNLASHILWVNWWIGMPILFALFGNKLNQLNPIDPIYDWITSAVPKKLHFDIRYPNWLGCWPATTLLLTWAWIEVVYPNAAIPKYIGGFILAWMIFCVCLMLVLGKTCFNQNINFFKIYFSYFGYMSVFQFCNQIPSQYELKIPFKGLLKVKNINTPGSTGFVVAMLASVLFDGLHGANIWIYFEHFLTGYLPSLVDINKYVPGALGILLVWAVLYSIYMLICQITKMLANMYCSDAKFTLKDIALTFSPSLIPIAFAYFIAHNFSSWMIQGQNFIPLISDPYNFGWNLLGTATYLPDISLVDAKTIWYVAIFSIVLGHVVSIVISHIRALALFKDNRLANWVALPLNIVMIIFTVISLLILAEPLVESS